MERLNVVGKIESKASLDVKRSKIGLGFEKLDRDVFDPEKAYDKVGALGVKWIRIQSDLSRGSAFATETICTTISQRAFSAQ